MIPETDVATLAARLASGDPVTLIDVREPWEHELARIPDARLIPLSTLAAASASLDPTAEYVIYCHHGARSANAVAWLRARGFTHASNLAGGIDAWSVEIDPLVKRY
jgi:rhodanese-related sulfurtransferase